MAREGRIYTIVAGTPIRLSPEPLIVERIFIQMQVGASGGLGYVMDGVRPGTTPVANTNPTVQLGPASTTSPGGNYSDADYNSSSISLDRIWIDGSHSGDLVLVSFSTKSR